MRLARTALVSLAVAALALVPAAVLTASAAPVSGPDAPQLFDPAAVDKILAGDAPDGPSDIVPLLGAAPLPANGNDPAHAPGIGDPIVTDPPQSFSWIAGAGIALAAVGAGGFLLVTRYVSPKEALKNPQRAMLYGFVRGNPGVHLKKLSDEFAMKTSSILWHIRKLEAAELVRSERANGFRVFYPVEGGIELKRVSRGITALQNAHARRLLEYAERHPGKQAQELSQALDIHVGTVRWHLRKLREFGLVEELVRDDGTLTFATPLGRRTLQTLLGVPVVATPSPVTALSHIQALSQAAPLTVDE